MKTGPLSDPTGNTGSPGLGEITSLQYLVDQYLVLYSEYNVPMGISGKRDARTQG